jgi:hypothetical protein
MFAVFAVANKRPASDHSAARMTGPTMTAAT